MRLRKSVGFIGLIPLVPVVLFLSSESDHPAGTTAARRRSSLPCRRASFAPSLLLPLAQLFGGADACWSVNLQHFSPATLYLSHSSHPFPCCFSRFQTLNSFTLSSFSSPSLPSLVLLCTPSVFQPSPHRLSTPLKFLAPSHVLALFRNVSYRYSPRSSQSLSSTPFLVPGLGSSFLGRNRRRGGSSARVGM